MRRRFLGAEDAAVAPALEVEISSQLSQEHCTVESLVGSGKSTHAAYEGVDILSQLEGRVRSARTSQMADPKRAKH